MTPRAGTGGGSRRGAGAGRAKTERGPRAPRAPRRGAAIAPAVEPGRLHVVGHGGARSGVAAEHAAGTLAPVLLVSGRKGVGKESFGFWVASLALCSGDNPPCGSCASCLKISRLQHPDVHWFFPVPPESAFDEGDWGQLLQRIREDPLDPSHGRFPQAASFRMHQAVEIRRLAATTSFEGRGRVFILGDYDQNPSDQVHNALLKVLEEPPRRTTFVLTSARPQGLPATILSRCRQIRLSPLTPPEMEVFLDVVAERRGEAVDPARRLEVRAMAEGRPGRALELLAKADDSMKEASELLRQVVRGGTIASYGWALTSVPRGSREDHDRRLDALGALWRDLLRVKAGVTDALVRPDLLELYEEGARRVEPERAAAAALQIEHGREQVQANVNAALVFWWVFRELAVALEDGATRPASLRAPRVP